jgi:HNH endonuclease
MTRDPKDFLRYDPTTGELFWTKRPSPRRAPGERAGAAIEHRGQRYLRVQLGGTAYLAHRLAWYLHYGDWPIGQIDHVNGDPYDNRIANLRDVSAFQNNQNKLMHRGGKIWGVHEIRGKWHATFKRRGKAYHVGVFEDPILAQGAIYGYLKARGWLKHFGFGVTDDDEVRG